MNEFRQTQFGGAFNRTQLHVNHSRDLFFFGDPEVSFKLNDAWMVNMQAVELPANKKRDAKSRFWKISLKGVRSGMNMLFAQAGTASFKWSLTIDVVDEVTLPGIMSDEGIMTRLFLHETRTPFAPGYSLEDAKTTMNYMRIVLDNRRFRGHGGFGFAPKTKQTVLQVITVPGQFGGFENFPNLLPKDTRDFRECLQIANDDSNGLQPKFAAHVQAALDAARAEPQGDPSKNGLYAWRTQGHAGPGPNFVEYKTLLGITFYALTDQAVERYLTAEAPRAPHAHHAEKAKQ